MPRRIKKLECPTHWKALEAVEVEVPGVNVHIDRCPTCQGVFLDKDEVKRLTGNEKHNDFLTRHVGLDSDSPRVCPACGMVMDMEDADGVRVDVCLSCFGVWLDAGELEQLKSRPAERFEPEEFTAENQKEFARAKGVAARDRKRRWNLFLYRLAGLDILDRVCARRGP